MLCGYDSRSPPAIQCPVPSRPPMSASGQTGYWNGSFMGTRPSILSAWRMLMAPAAGTRDTWPSGRNMSTSFSPSADQWPPHSFGSPEDQPSSPSLQSSGCHHRPHRCQPMGNTKWRALEQGWGMLQLVSSTPAQNLSNARESSMTFLSSPRPFSPAS